MTLGDIIVIAVLALVVGLIIRGMIRDKKQGKCCGCSGCSGCSSCSSCAHCGSCPGRTE
ncbi:MAG: FeoB-associated Cys-rich membrane protein [Oscillospiraceae bacterium]|nr:FeoB-associated Cys-rich membrane protein [Oscillospiraceae bacterium]